MFTLHVHFELLTSSWSPLHYPLWTENVVKMYFYNHLDGRHRILEVGQVEASVYHNLTMKLEPRQSSFPPSLNPCYNPYKKPILFFHERNRFHTFIDMVRSACCGFRCPRWTKEGPVLYKIRKAYSRCTHSSGRHDWAAISLGCYDWLWGRACVVYDVTQSTKVVLGQDQVPRENAALASVLSRQSRNKDHVTRHLHFRSPKTRGLP